MRACPQCGVLNGPEETFCVACGAYLAWDTPAAADRTAGQPEPGAASTPTAAPEVPPSDPGAAGSAPADPARPGLFRRLAADPARSDRPPSVSGPSEPAPSGAGLADVPPSDPTDTTARPGTQAPPIGMPGGAPPEPGGPGPGPAVPDPAVRERAVPERAAPERAAPKSGAANPAAPNPIGQAPAAPGPVAPGLLAPDATVSDATASDSTAPKPTRRAAGASRPAPESIQPAPVQPGRAVPRRPLPADTPRTEEEFDGEPCPRCGTANPPTRSFCRRCALPLTPAPEARRGSRWSWLRLPWRGRRADGAPFGRIALLLLVVAALIIGGVLLYPLGRAAVDDVRDRLATPFPVVVVSVAGSAGADAEHPPSAVADGVSNQFWSARVGDSVELTLDGPVRLLAVIAHTGCSAEPADFACQARAAELEITAISSTGETETVDVTLADRPGPQETRTGISDVERVRVTVRGAHGATDGDPVALGEIELFARR
ncbi:NADase-type glycan-binding domain-containing protein [Actinoalloteichus fjordicus]|uniref:Zinc ribbon domain-containing protein n=1 Tax=Actinoalloteichus fjordicus TaxID=1612552 RepID=A0AAC9LFZ2_9PSEU|nr:zinc ribbon domain-containing protein [Actinoalloteichus fjordicus]APU16170.1 hypothetical protein UA74_20725 [Actinoalloteichus fjordicus]